MRDEARRTDARRLELLYDYGVFEDGPAADFDDIVTLAARIATTPMAALSFIDEASQHIFAAVGLPVGVHDRGKSICNHTIAADGTLIVEDLTTDPRFADNPLVAEPPHARFYAGVPLASGDGIRFGALAVIDTAPRTASPDLVEDLERLGRQAVALLEAQRTERALRRAGAGKIAEGPSALGFHVANAPLAAIEWTPAFCVRGWSPRAEDLFGWTEREVLGRHPKEFAFVHPDDEGKAKAAIAEIRSGKVARNRTVNRNLTKTGETVYCEWHNSIRLDTNGRLVSVLSFVHDITERVLHEDRQRRALQRLLIAQKIARVGSYEVRLPDGSATWSDELFRLYGLDPGEIEPSSSAFLGFVHPEDRDQMIAARERTIRSGEPLDVEIRIVRPDGAIRTIHTLGELTTDEIGTPLLSGTTRDVTDQKEAEQALREQADLLRIAGRAARIGGWQVHLPERTLVLSDEALALRGLDPEQPPTVDEAIALYTPEAQSRIREVYEACIRDGTPFDEELQIVNKEGYRVWVRAIGEAVRDANGRIVALQGAIQDIHGRKRAEEKAARLADRLAATLENITDGFLTVDREWRFTYLNGEAERLLNRAREDLLGKNLWEEFSEGLGTVSETEYRRAMASGEAVAFEKYNDPLGTWFDLRAFPSSEGLAILLRDVSEQKAARETLTRQAALLDQARDAIVARELDGRIGFWNKGAERVYGWASEEVVGTHRNYYVDEDSFRTARAALDQRGEWSGRLRHRRKDGTVFTIEAHWSLLRDGEGAPTGVLTIATDISERLHLEEQLRQSQHLEAIGQLTGGVAHDFNNLLTVILGNAELLAEELPADGRERALAELTRTAAQRGSELTRRLLAFARRQPLEPRAVNINHLVTGMDGLLRRTISEDIDLETVQAGGLWTTFVDVAQLESAILNLAINARDAMPGGGRLTIETANTRLDQDYTDRHVEVAPGQYVLVAVTDTGSGIDPDHVDRVFEPFFTTKDRGKGTGLGLSMVYGFVKQSGGHIKMYSEIGQGTTVKIYLPRSDALVEQPADGKGAARPDTGTETVLVVEDDDLVREHAADQLARLGYSVRTAANGTEALAILHDHTDVDLLFTDVVMPGGMNGRELADAALGLRPEISVLYTSGYTENAIVHQGRLDKGVHLLQKPYRRAELARKVREVLDGASGRR